MSSFMSRKEALALYREGKMTEATGADAPQGRRR